MELHRVCMKDGYQLLERALDESAARQQAIARTIKCCETIDMSDSERSAATSVESVTIAHDPAKQ